MRRGWPDAPSTTPPTLVTTRSGPCAVIDEGPRDAPVVVLIAGVPGTVRDFRWLTPNVTDHLRCIRFDMPGFGATPLRSGLGFSIAQRAQFARSVVDALQVRDVTVIGHSMGAAVAIAMAVDHRDVTSRCGVWASPGLRPHRKFRQTYPGTVAKWMRWRLVGPLVRSVVQRGFAREGFPAALGGADIQTVMDYAAGLHFRTHAARVRALEVPTMVAYCDDDHLIETEICEELAAACPPGPRQIFADGGHNLQKTHANDLGAAIIQWLK